MELLELIHIECGTFNGIIRYKFRDKVISFRLGTPKFNDYGEYRIGFEDDLILYSEYIEKYPRNYKPSFDLNITVSSDIANIWFNNIRFSWPDLPPKELTDLDDDDGYISSGKDEDGDFCIYLTKWIKYNDWLLLNHKPYDDLIFKVAYRFYEAYQLDENIGASKSASKSLFLF